MPRPNMALTKKLDKSNWSLILRDQKNVKEERRRKRRGGVQERFKGMEL